MANICKSIKSLFYTTSNEFNILSNESWLIAKK